MDRSRLCRLVYCLGLSAVLLGSAAVRAASVDDAMKLYQALPPAQQQQLMNQYQGQLPATAVIQSQVETVQPTVTPRALERADSADAVVPDTAATTEPAAAEPDPVLPRFTDLKPFGYELFAGEPMTFAPVTDVPVPQGYTIGPGDVLHIQIFGKEPADYRLAVSRQGSISFPKLGPINVVGQSFEQAKALIEAQVAHQLIGAKLNISLGELRSIRVFVLGDAYRPGSYRVSALSTLSNALFVSGGIRDNGSLRQVQLKRRGQVVQTLDLYDFLLNGDNSNDATLQEGDVVFIPPVGARVWVGGEVNRPAIYELNGEASLAAVLRLAGGSTSQALTAELQLSRVAQHQRRLLGFDLNQSAGRSSRVEDGDQIYLPSILNVTQQRVRLTGYVSRSGYQPLQAGMRISDVVRRDDFKPQTDLEFAVLRRIRPNDSRYELEIINLGAALNQPGTAADRQLRHNDELVLLSLKHSRAEQLAATLSDLEAQTAAADPEPVVEIYGHVRNPGRYPHLAGMQLTQLVAMARGTTQGEELYPHFAVVEQSDHDAFVKQYQAFSPLELLTQQASVVLTPGSRVFLFSKNDIRFLSSLTVQQALQGEVGDDCAALNGLSNLAGSERAARLLSRTLGNVQALGCSELFSFEPALLPLALEYAVSVQGEVLETGLYPVVGQSTLDQLVRFAGGPTADADLTALQLMRYSESSKAMQTQQYNLHTKAQLLLQSGDVLTLRPQDSGLENGTVVLSGEFQYPGTYHMRRGETLSQLIERAGGLTEQAYPYGAVFSRESAKRAEAQAYLRAQRELKNGLFTTLSSGRLAMNGQASGGGMELYLQLLNQISDVEPLGRVVVEADPGLLEVRPEVDLLLESGDRLFMPKRPSTVSVAGQVLNPGSLQFKPGTAPDEYVDMAGGLTQAAESSRAFVVLPNGTARSLKLSAWNYSDQSIPPGSTLIVPRDLLPFDPMIMTSAVTDILSKLAITAASLNAISN